MPKVPDKGSVTRRGLAVLKVAIWEEPVVFSLSVLAAMLYGAMTVAGGWALGWATDHVLRPAFETGHTTFGAIASLVGLFLGIAVLNWLARDAEPSPARNAIVLANIVGFGCVTANDVVGVFSGDARQLAKVFLVVHLLFTLAFVVTGRAAMRATGERP